MPLRRTCACSDSKIVAIPRKKKAKSNVERSSGCETGAASRSASERRASPMSRCWSAVIHEPRRLSVVETAQTSCTEDLRKTIFTRSEWRCVQRRSWLVSWTSGSEYCGIERARMSSSMQMSIVLKPGSRGHTTKCGGVAESRESHTTCIHSQKRRQNMWPRLHSRCRHAV